MNQVMIKLLVHDYFKIIWFFNQFQLIYKIGRSSVQCLPPFNNQKLCFSLHFIYALGKHWISILWNQTGFKYLASLFSFNTNCGVKWLSKLFCKVPESTVMRMAKLLQLTIQRLFKISCEIVKVANEDIDGRLLLLISRLLNISLQYAYVSAILVKIPFQVSSFKKIKIDNLNR